MNKNEEKTATLFDIRRGSQNDGPGLRTTVFFKGCGLRCAWCHNPESQRFAPQLLYNPERCTGCGRCAACCPNGVHTIHPAPHTAAFNQCSACGRCCKACRAGALTIQGFSTTVEELLLVIQKDRIFYEHSGGGVTLSGGEPFLHSAFCLDLLSRCREEQIHTCAETSGHVPEDDFRLLVPLTDLFLFDCKITNTVDALKWIGADGSLIASNFHYVTEQRKPVILRCPIIPGVNDNRQHFDAICAIVADNSSVIKAELLPYHSFGVVKGEHIGLTSGASFRMPEAEEKDGWMDYLKIRLGEQVCWG